MFEFVLQTLAVWIFIPLLVIGWTVCLAQPLWDFVALWRTSRMPLLDATQPQRGEAKVGEIDKYALRTALSMLIAAEGTAEKNGRLLPRGARDLDFLLAYAALFVAGIVLGGGAYQLDIIFGSSSWAVLNILTGGGILMVVSAVFGSIVGVFSMFMSIPGLGNAEDSLIEPVSARSYYGNAQRILRGAQFHSAGMELDPSAVVDPAQAIYQSNKPYWLVLAVVRFPLLNLVRWTRLGPANTALLIAARQLRQEVEAAINASEQRNQPVRERMAS